MAVRDGACVFCGILDGREPGSFVCRGALVSAFMDIRPVTPGHLLIVSNDHYSALADVPPQTASQMFLTAQACAAALRVSGFESEGVNLIYADGAAAFQEVFHAHLHVIPRFRGDGFHINAPWDIHPGRDELDGAAAELQGLLPI